MKIKNKKLKEIIKASKIKYIESLENSIEISFKNEFYYLFASFNEYEGFLELEIFKKDSQIVLSEKQEDYIFNYLTDKINENNQITRNDKLIYQS